MGPESRSLANDDVIDGLFLSVRKALDEESRRGNSWFDVDSADSNGKNDQEEVPGTQKPTTTSIIISNEKPFVGKTTLAHAAATAAAASVAATTAASTSLPLPTTTATAATGSLIDSDGASAVTGRVVACGDYERGQEAVVAAVDGRSFPALGLGLGEVDQAVWRAVTKNNRSDSREDEQDLGRALERTVEVTAPNSTAVGFVARKVYSKRADSFSCYYYNSTVIALLII